LNVSLEKGGLLLTGQPAFNSLSSRRTRHAKELPTEISGAVQAGLCRCKLTTLIEKLQLKQCARRHTVCCCSEQCSPSKQASHPFVVVSTLDKSKQKNTACMPPLTSYQCRLSLLAGRPLRFLTIIHGNLSTEKKPLMFTYRSIFPCSVGSFYLGAAAVAL
jgi:hypothetical protein